MKKILNLLLVFFPIIAMSQTVTQNYIKTTTYKVPTQTAISVPTITQANQNITYFDGLGRPVQQVAHQQSGTGKDIVTPIEYDAFGRQAKDYLPYVPTAAASLDYKTTALTEVGTFYNTATYENTTNPFSQKEFEASPLNRVLKQATPGEDWKLGNGHEIRLDYQTNTNVDQVRRFGVSFIAGNTENPYLEDEGIYDPSQLYKTITKDENWQTGQIHLDDHTIQEFKDKEGHLVLKRTFDAGKWHDTYYVYDDYGNLTYVLPPKMFTYSSIAQPYIGQTNSLDTYNSGMSIFVSGGYSEVYIGQFAHEEDKFTLYLFADGFTSDRLKSGKIVDLNFTPNLPNISLGSIMVQDINGNPVAGGTAYIQDGDLYISSTGVDVYPNSDGYFEFRIVRNFSDFQATYTAPAVDRSTLNDLIYQYHYDKRNRVVEKKLPGKEWEYIVYDKLDRPVLTQDANLRTSNKWLFTKYDVFNRPVYTGEYVNTVKTTRADVQLLADAGTTLSETKQTVNTINGTTVYYSNNAFPNPTDLNLLTINYYDNYDFDLNGGGSAISYTVTPITNAKGLVTGNKVRILGTTSWITNLSYYDAKGRSVYSYSKNDYLATTSTVKSQLDFVGKTLETTSTHLRNSVTTSIVDIFTYDQAGRLTKQTQAINGAATPEIIVANTYDELGQLSSKKVGGKTIQGLQKVDYAYNIRGWLKSINDPSNLNQDNDLFGFALNYNTIVNSSLASYYQNKPLYNGNISSTSWKTNNLNPVLKQYNYTYDALNRFKNGSYLENNVSNSKFDEAISEYDRNGNIMSLSRNMQNPGAPNYSYNMDYLTYTYNNGNRLMKIDDNLWDTSYSDEGFKDTNKGSDDYGYDDNGNMTVDKNKGITNIIYNYLNLPTKIIFNTGKSIDYVYDATGAKQSKKVINSATTTTDYAGGFQYVNNVLKFFPQPEGYVEYSSGNFNYIYQYKDHLGNIRLSYADSNNDGIIAPPLPVIYQTVWEDGFESATGWNGTDIPSAQPLTAFDTTVKHSGNRSGRIDMDNSSNAMTRLVQSNQWTVINNATETQYRISGWIFIENTPQFSRGRLDLMMKKVGETNYMTLSDYTYTDGKGQWVLVQKVITVPANIKYLNLCITFENDTNNDYTARSIWYDDLKIEKVIPNSQNEIIAESSYYPFGLEHNTGSNVITSTSAGYKFKYNGKELQDELGLNMYDFGARNYDPALGRWMNVDPLAEKSRRFSPYTYALNNPVYFIDPDGMEAVNNEWIPDENGNLHAEAGDNKETLATYLGVKSENITLTSNNGSNPEDIKEGDVVTLNNVYTESIKNSTSDATLDNVLAGTSKTGATPEDNYNCWGAAIAGSQGNTIENGVGIFVGGTFDSILSSDYKESDASKAVFGKTVLRFADSNNEVQHGAVFYGNSKDGTTYVYSKNGWQAKPEVMKLSDLQTKIPSYGTVQGVNPNSSGFYQHK